MKASLQPKPMYCSRDYYYSSRFNQQYEKPTPTKFVHLERQCTFMKFDGKCWFTYLAVNVQFFRVDLHLHIMQHSCRFAICTGYTFISVGGDMYIVPFGRKMYTHTCYGQMYIWLHLDSLHAITNTEGQINIWTFG